MNDLTITEYRDIRVLTTQQIADAYGTDAKVISNNFNNNKDRYVVGKHYICLEGEELKEFKTNHKFYESSKINKLYLWTEKGAFLHAKSLNTDKAWEVYDHLVDTYFNRKKPLTLNEQIQILAQGNIELEHRVDKVEDKITNLEEDMPLYGCEIDEIQKHVKRRGVDILGGKQSEAYRDASIRGSLYSDIYSQLKREFGCVSSYKSIKRKYIADAHEFIDCYSTSQYLQEQINDANAQMSF